MAHKGLRGQLRVVQKGDAPFCFTLLCLKGNSRVPQTGVPAPNWGPKLGPRTNLMEHVKATISSLDIFTGVGGDRPLFSEGVAKSLRLTRSGSVQVTDCWLLWTTNGHASGEFAFFG